MLRINTPTGSLELLAEEERAVRAMTDEELCRVLNSGRDWHVLAALTERPQIRLDPHRGYWTSAVCTTRAEAAIG